MCLGSPDLRKECHFRRRERIAHAVSGRATIIPSVAPTHPFRRTANPAPLASLLRGIIALVAIALLRLPHDHPQRDCEPAASRWAARHPRHRHKHPAQARNALVLCHARPNALHHTRRDPDSLPPAAAATATTRSTHVLGLTLPPDCDSGLFCLKGGLCRQLRHGGASGPGRTQHQRRRRRH